MKKIMAAFLATAMVLSFVTGCGRVKEDDGLSHAPEWTKNAVLYEVNIRQYTAEGTFKAFEPYLDGLKEMGINTLWFMPVHPISKTNRVGSLGSYYSVDDYRAVNPEFGTEEDFKELIDLAHEKGFHVILDWVANHTGWDNPWIKEHPDWYTQEDGKIISPKGMGWNDVADLNYDNPEMRAEMISCMEYWVKEYDIDGFRCDYAPGVPADFWEEARKKLDKVKDLYFIEEDLGWVNEGLLDYAFDTNYSSKVYDALVAISHDSKSADKLKLYIPKMPETTFPMNYLDNHDVNSYDRTIADAFGTEKLPEMYALIFTLPGLPMIYSGDEIGNDKALAFMNKDRIDWNGGIGDYRGLISYLSRMKNEHEALYSGSYGGSFETADTGNKNILAFTRQTQKEKVTCIYNLSKRVQEDVDISALISGGEVLIRGAGGEYEEGGELPGSFHTFEPWEFYVIVETE